MAPFIEAHGLTKHYRKVHALDGFDLVAREGHVVALLGPNGAGKTTFIRMVATLTRPDAGTLRVAGIDVLARSRAVRTLIGLAGQYAAVEPTMTGRENLEMVGRLFGLTRRDARASDRVRSSTTSASSTPRTAPSAAYSGGMRRRVDLAASMVGSPRLLLLDEPTSGLDPRSRIELWESIRTLVERGTNVLLTTQYLDEADHLATDIVIVDHGRVVAAGTPSELKTKVGGDVVELHVQDPALLDARASRSRRSRPSLRASTSRPAACPSRSTTEPIACSTRCASSTSRRRRSTTSRCAGRPSTRCSSCSRERKRHDRDTRDRPPHAAEVHAHTTAGRGGNHPRGDVPAHLPLRVRRGDQRRLDEVRRLPRARFHRHDRALHRLGRVGRRRRRRRAGLRRPAAIASDPAAAAVAGRAIADTGTLVWGLGITTALGFVVGFRVATDAPSALAAFALCIVFGFGFGFAFICIGLFAGSAQAAQGLSLLVFPLTFVSSAYIPVATMPSWMRGVARNQPITIMTNAARALTQGSAVTASLGHTTGYYVVLSLLWTAGLVVVFAPLAVWRYQRVNA